jgi:D-glycero-D-manno-heptose 1,7-bisphosphate phosphatase
MRKAAFLDRDGVINRKAPQGQYITRWEELEILPYVPEAISKLNSAGWLVVVITNQRCVAKGLVTEQELKQLHEKMLSALAQSGARIDAIYSCPHELDDQCECRKPAPGMLLRAASELSIDLDRSWMVGDSTIDIEAGRAAGCRTIFIQDAQQHARVQADRFARDLHAAVNTILATSVHKEDCFFR